MRRLALLLLLAASARAQIVFDHPYPDSHTPVRATVVSTVCAPDRPAVTISGSSIDVHIGQIPRFGCIPQLQPREMVASLGVLPPGTYDVRTSGEGIAPMSARLFVRGVDPFRVTPPGAPVSGGGEVGIVSDADWPIVKPWEVFFDGIPAKVVSVTFDVLTVEPPPHAPGPVDVTVSSNGRSETSRAAFVYYEEGAAPNPAAFERVLFPVAFEGSGAYGSRWTTERSAYGRFAVFAAPPCGSCATKLVGAMSFDRSTKPDGLSLFIGRGAHEDLTFSSRIRDLSRLGESVESAGTDIPVVREDDFRRFIAFSNIPTGPNLRATLRLWATDESAFPRTARLSPDGLPFLTLDVTERVASLRPGTPLYFVAEKGGRIWALVTITNNETQQVTVMAPR